MAKSSVRFPFAVAVHAVVFSRGNNENATTAQSPLEKFDASKHDAEFFSRTGVFCMSSDDDRLESREMYCVQNVVLPEWLSVEERISASDKWAFAWGTSREFRELNEKQQRALLGFTAYERAVYASLLAVKSFRSEFRKSLRAQLDAWIDTPAEERKHKHPLSGNQFDAIARSVKPWEVKHAEQGTYDTLRWHMNRGLVRSNFDTDFPLIEKQRNTLSGAA